MSNANDLLDEKAHFSFGKNWASYATLVGETQIAEATKGLQRLVGADLSGKRMLDLGCGSGLHALAALRLGAAEVVLVDIDRDSVATATALLKAHAASSRWRVMHASVFDLDPALLGQFDIVYSWGVLHHTGDMNRALRCAAALVGPKGLFVFALYRRTTCCRFWKLEKRWYARSSPRVQRIVRCAYVLAYRVALVVTGRSFRRYVAEYERARGMEFFHDVHDWLGGWPYESISAAEVERFMGELGLIRVRTFGRERVGLGILGTGCNEYVYTRSAAGHT